MEATGTSTTTTETSPERVLAGGHDRQSTCGIVSIGMAPLSIALIPFIGLGSLAINAAGVLVAIFGFFEPGRRTASAWWGLILHSGICIGCGAIAAAITVLSWATVMVLVPFLAR